MPKKTPARPARRRAAPPQSAWDRARSALHTLPRRSIALGLAFVLTVPVLFGAGFGAGQLWQLNRPAEPGVPGDYPTALTKAADALAGSSYKFTVEQLRAPSATPAPSGSPSPSPTPTASSNNYGTSEGYNHFVAVGATDGTSFWQTIYALPLNAPVSDYTSGQFQFAYIATPTGGTWRDEGSGWYPYTGIAPGEGFDPVTAAHLPDLLRHMTNVRSEPADDPHAGLVGFSGQVDSIDYPGVVSSDGLPYTSSPVTVIAWLDSSGRLARLEASANNLDIGQDVVVSLLFEYSDIGPAPSPSPLASEAPAAVDETPAPTGTVQP